VWRWIRKPAPSRGSEKTWSNPRSFRRFLRPEGSIGIVHRAHSHPGNGRDELIVSQPNRLIALHPKTGQELWFCGGLNPLVYASPIYGEGILVAMGGFTGTSIAVKPGGSGDVTAHRLWEKRRTKQRLGSGVIHEGHIYVFNSDGIAECLNLRRAPLVGTNVKGAGPKRESWPRWSSRARSRAGLVRRCDRSGDASVFELIAQFRKMNWYSPPF
jgi:hypothetical protein